MTLVLVLSGQVFLQSLQLRKERDAAIAARSEAEAIAGFLEQAFILADPLQTDGSELTAREVLDFGASQVQEQLRSQPVLQAALLETLAKVYLRLGHYDQSGELAESALELRRRQTTPEQLASALELLGEVRLGQQMPDEQIEPLFDEALNLRREQYDPDHPSLGTSYFHLAYIYHMTGRQTEAEDSARRSVDLRQRLPLPPGHTVSPEVTDSLFRLGQVLTSAEDPGMAEEYLKQAVENLARLGKGHERNLSTAQHELAKLLHYLGRTDESDQAFQDTIALNRRLLPGHPLLADSLLSWATILRQRGQWVEAETALREAIDIYRSVGGEDDDLVVAGLIRLGHMFLQKPDLVAAEAPLLEAWKLSDRSLPPDDLRRGALLNNLISVYQRRGDYKLAKPLCSLVLPFRRHQLAAGIGSPSRQATGLGISLTLCGEVHANLTSLELGRIQIEEAREIFSKEGATWRLAAADGVLGSLLIRQGQRDRGQDLLRSSLAQLSELRPGSHYHHTAQARVDNL